MNKAVWLLLALAVFACGKDKAKDGEKDSQEESSTKKKKKKKKKSSDAEETASAKEAASSKPAPSASAAPTAAVPVTLATMFDGAPNMPVPTTAPYGRVTIGLPEGFERVTGWDLVDSFRSKAGRAGVVLLTLDVSAAYLDMNIATWVKVPFATNEEVKWEPREPGQVGAAHLDAQIAHGTGKFGSDDAEFWQVATAFDGKKYGAVFIAGLKNSAEPQERAQMIAVIQSVASK
jgi:hypothetical protein